MMIPVLANPGRQLLWLLTIAVITVLLTAFVFGWEMSDSTIDIHLHDTYYVIDAIHLVILLFLGISFVLFLAKEFRMKYTRSMPNIII